MSEKVAENLTETLREKQSIFRLSSPKPKKTVSKYPTTSKKSLLLTGKQLHLLAVWLQVLRPFHRSSVATS